MQWFVPGAVLIAGAGSLDLTVETFYRRSARLLQGNERYGLAVYRLLDTTPCLPIPIVSLDLVMTATFIIPASVHVNTTFSLFHTASQSPRVQRLSKAFPYTATR